MNRVRRCGNNRDERGYLRDKKVLLAPATTFFCDLPHTHILFCLENQGHQRHLQSLGSDHPDGLHRRVTPTCLNPGNIGSIHLTLQSKLFLRKILLRPFLFDCLTKGY